MRYSSIRNFVLVLIIIPALFLLIGAAINFESVNLPIQNDGYATPAQAMKPFFDTLIALPILGKLVLTGKQVGAMPIIFLLVAVGYLLTWLEDNFVNTKDRTPKTLI